MSFYLEIYIYFILCVEDSVNIVMDEIMVIYLNLLQDDLSPSIECLTLFIPSFPQPPYLYRAGIGLFGHNRDWSVY